MLTRTAIIIVLIFWQLPQLPPPMHTPWYRRARASSSGLTATS